MRLSKKNRSAAEAALDPTLRARVHALIDEGAEIYDRFDREVRDQNWHPFVPGDYGGILQALLEFRAPGGGLKFLEWGSATGVVVIMADLLGFEAYGIELDAGLVSIARSLADWISLAAEDRRRTPRHHRARCVRVCRARTRARRFRFGLCVSVER
jgi:predicted cobalt transporter CbtA